MFCLTHLGDVSKSILIAHTLPMFYVFGGQKEITKTNVKILQINSFVQNLFYPPCNCLSPIHSLWYIFLCLLREAREILVNRIICVVRCFCSFSCFGAFVTELARTSKGIFNFSVGDGFTGG